MKQRKLGKPSPAIIVAVLALVAALAGTAVAGPSADKAVSIKKVNKTAKKALKKGKNANKKAKAAQGSADTAQSTASAAQAAADSANSKLACPGGTTLIDGSCIETSARSAAGYATAENTCLGAGRRLPSRAELTSAALEDIFNGIEWTNSLYVNGTDSGVAGVSEAGETVALADTNAPTPYRCVAPVG